MQINELGVELRDLRLRKGFTQAELAGLVDLDPMSIRRIEHGDQTPTLGRLVRLAKALGCRVEISLVTVGETDCKSA